MVINGNIDRTLSFMVGLGAGWGGIVCRFAASGIDSSLSPDAKAVEYEINIKYLKLILDLNV